MKKEWGEQLLTRLSELKDVTHRRISKYHYEYVFRLGGRRYSISHYTFEYDILVLSQGCFHTYTLAKMETLIDQLEKQNANK